MGRRSRRGPAGRSRPWRRSARDRRRRRHRQDSHADGARGPTSRSAAWHRSGSCCSPSRGAPPTTCSPRAAALSGHREWARRLRGGTFHAVAHQFISSYAEPLGLQPGFSLLDPADAADVMDLLRDEQGFDDGRGPCAALGHPRRGVLALCQHPPAPRRGAGDGLSLVRASHRGHCGPVPGLCRPQAGQGPGGLRRPVAAVAGARSATSGSGRT